MPLCVRCDGTDEHLVSVQLRAWESLLQSCDFFEKPVGKSPDGMEVVAFSTAWGDGLYPGNDGEKYYIGCGLIGLVPVTPATEAEFARHKDAAEKRECVPSAFRDRYRRGHRLMQAAAPAPGVPGLSPPPTAKGLRSRHDLQGREAEKAHRWSATPVGCW